MKYPRLLLACMAIVAFSFSAEASDRYTIRNARGQVTGRVTTCVNGTCGKITDAAGFGKAFGMVTANCKSCHEGFRIKKG